MVNIKNTDVIDALIKGKDDPMLAAEYLLEKFEISNITALPLKRKISRLKKPKVSKTSEKYIQWLSSTFIEFEEDTESIQLGPSGDNTGNVSDLRNFGGRPNKRLCDNPSRNTTAQIMEKPIQYLIDFAADQRIPLDEVIDILNEHCCKKKKVTKVSIPTEDATTYFLNGGFSSRSWTELRLFLLKYDVELPTRNSIDSLKTEFQPKVISQEIKCSVSYPELLHDTVKGLVQSEKMEIKDGDVLELVAKTGIDGSGCHKVRHQFVNSVLSFDENPHLDPTVYTNYLLCSMAPLFLFHHDSEKVLLWKNPSPNSIFYARPLSLVRAKESRDVIEKEYDFLFAQIKKAETQNLKITGREVKLKVRNTVSMVDGKMVGILQGDTGSSKCHLCTSSVQDINNVVNILQGFVINKDYKSCMDSWKKVEEGQIEWSSTERKGQCHMPLVPVNNFCLLHWKLRSFDT